jgi:hypothetical protein
MIYGYVDRIVNERVGHAQMREVSIAAAAASLRALAAFLRSAADELDAEPRSVLWHLHVPEDLRQALGCDVVVGAPDDGNRPEVVLPYVTSE